MTWLAGRAVARLAAVTAPPGDDYACLERCDARGVLLDNATVSERI